MVGILIAVFWFAVIFLFVAFLLPMLAVSFAGQFIAKSARLSADEKFKVKVYFYFSTGALVGLGIAMSTATGPISFLFNFLLAALIWPLGFTLQVTGSFQGEESLSLVMYGGLFFGFVITQLLAARMILQRADRET